MLRDALAVFLEIGKYTTVARCARCACLELKLKPNTKYYELEVAAKNRSHQWKGFVGGQVTPKPQNPFCLWHKRNYYQLLRIRNNGVHLLIIDHRLRVRRTLWIWGEYQYAWLAVGSNVRFKAENVRHTSCVLSFLERT